MDILATKPYVSDKGCQMFLKLAIVKTVILGATLFKTQRNIDICFLIYIPYIYIYIYTYIYIYIYIYRERERERERYI